MMKQCEATGNICMMKMNCWSLPKGTVDVFSSVSIISYDRLDLPTFTRRLQGEWLVGVQCGSAAP